ncbi:TetR family transcriptional regulator [Prauserella marina]|uniref:DNA-binding transcriptional regulator, AcrR family n=1 Tax=Prauserella marina TaxID=530584 RepID=A0A222VXS4_9PSEU|nr:TetR/AcrR family transcriptional regulator [Prauserella marina]ASR38729.1 TetR family transcriptional regulator [Prauserella marina]PWV82077.1 TetR family transcriptional regulator [Prauserella marina]SDD18909.1 DNA-binding transcriptional regulator, AcrR family [Prauserella marina]
MADDVKRAPERAKRLPRAVREKQILDAAVRVFSLHGYHSASMDEISEVAGVSKPMIYSYLGAKEDLFLHCIRREAGRLLEAVQAGIKPDLSPDMQLWHGLRSFYGFVAEYRESWTVLHRQALTVGGPFAGEIDTLRGKAIELVSALVVSAGSRKGLAEQAEFSGEGLAVALVGAAESLADWWLDHSDVSDGVLASWLMNLIWLGFNDLVEGEVWRPTEQ